MKKQKIEQEEILKLYAISTLLKRNIIRKSRKKDSNEYFGKIYVSTSRLIINREMLGRQIEKDSNRRRLKQLMMLIKTDGSLFAVTSEWVKKHKKQKNATIIACSSKQGKLETNKYVPELMKY